MRAMSRFSHPLAAEEPYGPDRYAVIYCAEDLLTAYLEVVLRDAHEYRDGAIVQRQSRDLDVHAVATIVIREALTLVDVTDIGPILLGMPTDALRARRHGPGRNWALAIHDHPARPDGILYPSRLANRTAIAVFDRAIGKLDAVATTPLADHSDLPAVLDVLRIALEP